jgi:secondary thiamine-phosphate synthase enzyme
MSFHVFTRAIRIRTSGKGTREISSEVAAAVHESGIQKGLAHVFVQHTSCSLVLFENADPSARADLHAFFDHLVPEDTPFFAHTTEGPDDMPSHIRMALTRSSETLPVSNGCLQLGTWQGIFLFEHRRIPHTRNIVITVFGERPDPSK